MAAAVGSVAPAPIAPDFFGSWSAHSSDRHSASTPTQTSRYNGVQRRRHNGLADSSCAGLPLAGNALDSVFQKYHNAATRPR